MKKQLLIVLCLSVTLLANADTQTKKTDKTTEKYHEKAFLGIAYRVVPFENSQYQNAGFAYRVLRVINNTAAEIAGLQAGDEIIAFDDQDLNAVDKAQRHRFFSDYIKSKKMGDTLVLSVIRNKRDISSGGKKIANRTALKNIIDNQKADSALSFKVAYQSKQLTIEAKLKVRKTISQLPSNQSLFPMYENSHSVYTKLAEKTISHFNLEKDYQELLKRYDDNELWDDGHRLNIFRYLRRAPLKLTPVIDQRLLEIERISQSNDLAKLTQHLLTWLDVGATMTLDSQKKLSNVKGFNDLTTQTNKQTLEEKLDFISGQVNEAEQLRQQALAKLTRKELAFLNKKAPDLLTRLQQSFYIDKPGDLKTNNDYLRVMTLAKKVDWFLLSQAFNKLTFLTKAHWLADFKNTVLAAKKPLPITVGSNAGEIIIAGTGDDKHQKKYALIIDLGGHDFYGGDTTLARQGLSVVVDLSGNDIYQHTRPYQQGGAFLGISLIYDGKGDDTYTHNGYGQAFALLALAVVIDKAGNDVYSSAHFAQGVAFFGLALLLDKAGDDRYHANVYAQGLGGVKGLGVLLDNSGDDYYFATGSQESSYRQSGVFKSASQGVGLGFRGYASGGIGILLDGQGRDEFRGGNFSQGVGYFYGLGILKNSGNDNDDYHASRYSQGAAAHSAIGVLIDAGGDDFYTSINGVSQSAAWDLSLSSLWDKNIGNDVYRGSNAFASHNGFSLFIDGGGQDSYQGIAGGRVNDYHGGVSFGIFVDDGGEDDFYLPKKYRNNALLLSNNYGLFLDLPLSAGKTQDIDLLFTTKQ